MRLRNLSRRLSNNDLKPRAVTGKCRETRFANLKPEKNFKKSWVKSFVLGLRVLGLVFVVHHESIDFEASLGHEGYLAEPFVEDFFAWLCGDLIAVETDDVLEQVVRHFNR